jgi:hypothetical protein
MSQIVVKATISRNYGPFSVSFGIEREVEVTNGGDILTQYNLLCDVIEAQIHDYEVNRLPKMPAAPSKGIEADSKPQPAKWYPASKLLLNVSKGKKMYNIIPGNLPKYSQYGVPVYFDSQSDLDEAAAKHMLAGEFSVSFPAGMMVLIDESKGKPRVLGLKHKDQIGEA